MGEAKDVVLCINSLAPAQHVYIGVISFSELPILFKCPTGAFVYKDCLSMTAISRWLCLATLIVIFVQAIFGQSPVMFPGQPPMGRLSPFGGGGGMFSNPLMMTLAMSGLDLNKLMYLSMMMNGGGFGGSGSMLPAFGFMNAIN